MTGSVGRASFSHPMDGDAGVTATTPFTWSAAGSGTQGHYLTVGASTWPTPGLCWHPQTSYQLGSLPAGATEPARIYTKVDGNYQRYQDITVTT